MGINISMPVSEFCGQFNQYLLLIAISKSQNTSFGHADQTIVKLQWLEHRWLVYHGYFELVLGSLGKNPVAADIIIFGIQGVSKNVDLFWN